LTLRYSRSTTRDTVPAAEAQVRAHLSAIATEDDNPATHAAEVRIEQADDDNGDVLVIGELDAEPNAPYLRPGFTPEQDIAANPLTVESIEESS
jgi:hypothetical protein